MDVNKCINNEGFLMFENVIEAYNEENSEQVNFKMCKYNFELTNQIMSKMFPGKSWLFGDGSRTEDSLFVDDGRWGSSDPFRFISSTGLTEKTLYCNGALSKNFKEFETGYGRIFLHDSIAGECTNLLTYSPEGHKPQLVYVPDEDGNYYDVCGYPKSSDFDLICIYHI